MTPFEFNLKHRFIVVMKAQNFLPFWGQEKHDIGLCSYSQIDLENLWAIMVSHPMIPNDVNLLILKPTYLPSTYHGCTSAHVVLVRIGMIFFKYY